MVLINEPNLMSADLHSYAVRKRRQVILPLTQVSMFYVLWVLCCSAPADMSYLGKVLIAYVFNAYYTHSFM